jgi:hypothetical protein
MATSDDTIGETLDGKGWQCGATIPPEMYQSVIMYLRHDAGASESREIAPDDWLIVLSQTCDVVARKLVQEPLVEVLWCHVVGKRRRQFLNRRSTRELDFRPDSRQLPNLYLSAHATRDRYVIPRQVFADFSPRSDRRLSDKGSRWTATLVRAAIYAAGLGE